MYMKLSKQFLALIIFALCYSTLARPDIPRDKEIIRQTLAKNPRDWDLNNQRNLQEAQARLQAADALNEIEVLALIRLVNEATGGPGSRINEVLDESNSINFGQRSAEWDDHLQDGNPNNKWGQFITNPIDSRYAIDMNLYAQRILAQEPVMESQIQYLEQKNLITEQAKNNLRGYNNIVKNLIFKRQLEYANKLLDEANNWFERVLFHTPGRLDSPEAIKNKVAEIDTIIKLTERIRREAAIFKPGQDTFVWVDHLAGELPIELMNLKAQFLVKKEELFAAWHNVIMDKIIDAVLQAVDSGKQSMYGTDTDRNDIWNKRDAHVIDIGRHYLNSLDKYRKDFYVVEANVGQGYQNVTEVIIPEIEDHLNIQQDILDMKIDQPKRDIYFKYRTAKAWLDRLESNIGDQEEAERDQAVVVGNINALNTLLTAGDPAKNIRAYINRDDRSPQFMEDIRNKLQDDNFKEKFTRLTAQLLLNRWDIESPQRLIREIVNDLDAALLGPPPPPPVAP